MGRLAGLPEELISNIACKLGSDDKCALRLTCRALEEKSHHEFATEHFSAKCVHFTTDSLKSLVDISHSRLSKYVRKVYIITALFAESTNVCSNHPSAHWHPSTREKEAYKFYVQDQVDLCRSKNDEEMLKEAFKSLHSLEALILIDSELSLPHDVDYRGSNKVKRLTGNKPIGGLDCSERSKLQGFRDHLEHICTTMLSALAGAGAEQSLPLRSLKTKCMTSRSFLNPARFTLPKSALRGLRSVAKNVTRLQLQFRTPEAGARHRDALFTFAACFSNLKNLALEFDYMQRSGFIYQRLTKRMDFSHLESLSLKRLSTSASLLIDMVLRAENVQELRLDSINISEGSWPSVLKALAMLEHLEHLHLMYLTEAGNKSFFLKQSELIDDSHHHGFMDYPVDALYDDWTDEDEEDDDDSDDDLPDLHPVDDDTLPESEAGYSTEAVTSQAGEPSNATSNTPQDTDQTRRETENLPDYIPPNTTVEEFNGERGFYICVEGHDLIARRLKTFAEQYNVGDSASEPNHIGNAALAALHGMVAVPQGPAMNALINAMGGPLGAGPVQHNHAPAPAPAQSANTPTTTGAGGINIPSTNAGNGSAASTAGINVLGTNAGNSSAAPTLTAGGASSATAASVGMTDASATNDMGWEIDYGDWDE